MRLNFMTTTWITLLTLASLLMSGFVAGSPAMNVAMATQIQTSMPARCTEASVITHTDNAMQTLMQANTSQCDVSHDMMHSCCDTTCTNALALMGFPSAVASLVTTQTQYQRSVVGDVIHRTQTLYRPPSA
ncbi:hypothetical protein LIA75_000106 [Vibrio fluvialis]|nr:hypothetical protein [Vibrio fluvialis]